ncbi:MAG: Crp/Fnr family transcriptional regulator [Bacteroidales bacterium]|nr:Crp/Fnr family transcriptional regulator [Bacteroidales bacterium]MCF8334465.1 Crp/Fnr family transcriptional regulator [Bacteroidales bacterium]
MSIQPGHIANTDNEFNCINCKNENCYINQYIIPDKLPIVTNMKSVYSITKGSKIFPIGQLVEGIYFIYSGKVKITYQRDGKEQLIRLAKDGAIVGHRGINQQMVYPINAVALADTTICFLPMESFFKLISENKDFSYQIMMFFADELERSEKETYELDRKNNTERTAYALLKFLKAFGVDDSQYLNYSPNVMELADTVHLTSEKVNQALKTLKAYDIVSGNDGNFRIDQGMALESVAEDSADLKNVKTKNTGQ